MLKHVPNPALDHYEMLVCTLCDCNKYKVNANGAYSNSLEYT